MLFWESFGQEVCRPCGLDGAERMLDRLATLRVGWYQGIEQMLVLPSRDLPLRSCLALAFKRTIRTRCGPVARQHLTVFLVRKTIWQPVPSWTPRRTFPRKPKTTSDDEVPEKRVEPEREKEFLRIVLDSLLPNE